MGKGYLKIAVTGHRPDKLGGYSATENFKAIRRHMRSWLQLQQTLSSKLRPEKPTLISGGALGIDQFWMEVGLYLELPVIAAIPFLGYDAKWPLSSRQEYKELLDQCHEVLYISEPGYDATKLQIRNKWMVDECDLLVAYWDGSKGGTKNCYDYAVERGKPIERFNPKDIIL